jgi:hypothetical protein
VEALQETALARLVATAPGVYPLLSALHLLGIALLLAPVIIADLRLVGLADARLDGAIPVLLRTARRGFALAATTGVALFLVQAADYAANAAFLAKLGLIAAAGANAALLHRRVAEGALIGRGHARAAAWASLLLWSGALLMGRWIAFV